MTDDELRALDHEIAELLGWTTEQFSDGTYWRDPSGNLWPYLPCFSGGGSLPMDAGARWEGFGLLVEACERRGWRWSIDSPDKPSAPGVKHDAMVRGNYYLGNGPQHAFALAMRDALRAAKEREG